MADIKAGTMITIRGIIITKTANTNIVMAGNSIKRITIIRKNHGYHLQVNVKYSYKDAYQKRGTSFNFNHGGIPLPQQQIPPSSSLLRNNNLYYNNYDTY